MMGPTLLGYLDSWRMTSRLPHVCHSTCLYAQRRISLQIRSMHTWCQCRKVLMCQSADGQRQKVPSFACQESSMFKSVAPKLRSAGQQKQEVWTVWNI